MEERVRSIPQSKLAILFLVNGIFNILGGIILFIAPYVIAQGLNISHKADFLWYLLGASSLAFAVLSLYAKSFKEKESINGAVVTLMTFHGFAFMVSVWAIMSGVTSFAWASAFAHAIFLSFFWYFSFTRS